MSNGPGIIMRVRNCTLWLYRVIYAHNASFSDLDIFFRNVAKECVDVRKSGGEVIQPYCKDFQMIGPDCTTWSATVSRNNEEMSKDST